MPIGPANAASPGGVTERTIAESPCIRLQSVERALRTFRSLSHPPTRPRSGAATTSRQSTAPPKPRCHCPPTTVIGADGIIEFAYVKADYTTTRAEPAAVLAQRGTHPAAPRPPKPCPEPDSRQKRQRRSTRYSPDSGPRRRVSRSPKVCWPQCNRRRGPTDQADHRRVGPPTCTIWPVRSGCKLSECSDLACVTLKVVASFDHGYPAGSATLPLAIFMRVQSTSVRA